jgi:hypoxia up-regulated 1
LYAAVASVLLLASSAAANVIGVDLGMDYMKVALVAPRRPLEIVTNTASKRKTEVAINFDRGERSFGGDALVMLSRKPEQTFTKMTSLLGRSLEHPDVQALESTGLPPLTWNATRGGMSLHLVDRGNEADYLPEELVAMVLSHAYDITEMFGYSVRDAVLAVPQFWTAHERRAMSDAVELSGLSAISALDENTAAALQYGIDRAHDEPHNVLFYNIGAGATQATIVTYGPKLEKGKNVGEFTVRGKAWDTGLGGHWFDLVLTDLLAVEFNKQWKKGDVREYPKAMAKLRVHSSKVKQVLSANAEIPVTIQSLHDDVDFTALVTRPQFETAAKSLLGRVTAPVTAALAAANLTVADLHGVEVIGGGVRIPKVQELLREHLQPLDLGVHLNGDEAVALGAAFSGANASRAFHVRQVNKRTMFTYRVYRNFSVFVCCVLLSAYKSVVA